MFSCLTSKPYIEPFLYTLKIVFILILFVFTLANESMHETRAIVNDYPNQEGEKFVLEMLLMMITLGFVMSGIGWMRQATCSSTYHITIASMVIGAILHILQQYSGIYNVFYSPIKHNWPESTKIAAITLVSLFSVLMVIFFMISLCTFNITSLLGFNLFLQGLLFAAGTSIPYLLVSYNRKNRFEVQEDTLTTIMTLFAMFGMYYVFEYTHTLDSWYPKIK